MPIWMLFFALLRRRCPSIRRARPKPQKRITTRTNGRRKNRRGSNGGLPGTGTRNARSGESGYQKADKGGEEVGRRGLDWLSLLVGAPPCIYLIYLFQGGLKDLTGLCQASTWLKNRLLANEITAK